MNGQTGNLQEWLKSDGTKRARMYMGSSQDNPVFTMTSRTSFPAYYAGARIVLDSASGSATQFVIGQDSVATTGIENVATSGNMVFANNKGAGVNFEWRTGVTFNEAWGTTGTSRMTLTAAGVLDLPTAGSALNIAGTKVVGTQGAAVADATDAGSAITQLNALLARARAHGLIAT
jgi:hypothetical protein